MDEDLGRFVDGPYGKVREIITDTGHKYYVGNSVVKSRNHVRLYDPEYCDVGRAQVRGDHPLLGEIFAVMGANGEFDDEGYRALFIKLGLDPDCGRPTFRGQDLDVAKALEWKHPWPGSDVGDAYYLNELANDLSELLRIDRHPDLKSYFACQEALETWTSTADIAPFEKAFDRVDVTRLMSTTRVLVEIDVLPSWSAIKDHRMIEPCLDIEMWSDVFGHDDQGMPGNFPTAFTGIVVEPDLYDETHPNWAHNSSWYKVINLARQRVRQRLMAQGVLFLSKDAVVGYLSSEEAVYWRWKQRNDSAWENPSFAHLSPRTPTLAETMRWRITKPDTPIYDRFGRQVAKVD